MDRNHPDYGDEQIKHGILWRLWHLWYNQKRSVATTPITPGRHPKPAYLHPTIKGVRTMDILLLNPRTARKQPTGIQIKKIVSKMLTIYSLFSLSSFI